MFSLFKKDPLKEKLKRAKKIKKLKDKLFWKRNAEKIKEDKRISKYIHNGICPECGETTKLEQTVDGTDTTDNYYKCTNCLFETHRYCDEDGD